MTTEQIIKALESLIAQYYAELPKIVPVGADLQAALDVGGVITLEPGVYEAAGYTVTKSGTTIIGNGATLRGTTAPALRIKPGVTDVLVQDLTGETKFQSVFQIGDNMVSTQGTLDLVPKRITFERLKVLSHLGKRGFEINGTEVVLRDCSALNVWAHDGGYDSQAIGILNTPGQVLVEGGEFSAGSEVIMVGGDTVKIPDILRSDLTFRNLRLFRPDEWRTDGVKRAVKNLFELKAGINVLVENVLMEGHWPDAQPGWAIVLTPRNGQAIKNVVFDKVTLRKASAGFNIMGANDTTPASPFITTGVVIKNSRVEVSGADMTYTPPGATTAKRGTGIPIQLLGGGLSGDPQPRLGSIHVENSYLTGDNYYGRLVSLGSSYTVESLKILNSAFMVPYYYGRGPVSTPNEKPLEWFLTLDVSGNTIGDATAMCKTQYPVNNFVTKEAFQALPVG